MWFFHARDPSVKQKKHLYEQAQKAMYGIIRKIREFKLPIECQFDLFDKVVVPVLLYGSEVWGYERLEIIERLHLKYLKYIFNLKSSTPSYMVYGETGRFPLYISIYCRMISYWAKLFSGPENKIVYTMYKYLFKQYSDDSVNNPWLQCIQTIFNSCGLSYVWQNQGQNVNAKMISCIIRQNLQDQFIQQWYSDENNSSKSQVVVKFDMKQIDAFT